ncbi:hypothetical protein ACFV4N_42580, partial [Actinosynnema sp. NPDC059797]
MRTNEVTSPRCSFRTAREFEDMAGAEVLGAIRHSDRAGPVRWERDRPVLPLHVVRPGVPEVVEVWTATGPVSTGEHRGLHYAHDGEVLFGAASTGTSAGCGEAVREAYLAAFDLVDRLGYPHLFRTWNAIGGITDRDAD